MSWADPQYLWLLALLPLLIGLHVWRYLRRRKPALVYSAVPDLKNLPGNYRTWGIWLGPLLFWISYGLIILALARPQLQNATVERHIEGIDIVMRSEEHTSELQSRGHLVCRLLLEKKKTIATNSVTVKSMKNSL